MRPDFGCNLMQLVFAGNSDELASATQFLVQGALQQWLGELIQVEAVEVVAGVAFGPLFDPPLPPLFEHVDFALYAPGSLPSPFPTGTAVSR